MCPHVSPSPKVSWKDQMKEMPVSLSLPFPAPSFTALTWNSHLSTCPLLCIPESSLLGQTTMTSYWSACFCPHPLLTKEKQSVKNKSCQLLPSWHHSKTTCNCRTKSTVPTMAGYPSKLPLPVSLPTHPSSLSKRHGLQGKHICARPFAQAVPRLSHYPSTGLGCQMLREAFSEAFLSSELAPLCFLFICNALFLICFYQSTVCKYMLKTNGAKQICNSKKNGSSPLALIHSLSQRKFHPISYFSVYLSPFC